MSPALVDRRWVLIASLLGAAAEAAAPGSTERAEALAARALQSAGSSEALADARRALGLTESFNPVEFVRAGRKGEVVEDEFLAARAAYRRHRSPLYEAVGECLVRSGKVAEGARYLRRAVELDPRPERRLRLARALVALHRGREALGVLVALQSLPLPAEALAVAEQAADAAGLPSLQAEIDRVRLAGQDREPRPVFRPAPLVLPERARLDSGGPVRIDAGVTVVYAADASCRTCSADLEQIKRQLPAGARVMVLPASPDRDQELRQALRLYRYDWPVMVGAGTPRSLGLEPPQALIVARDGLVAVTLKAPFGPELGGTLQALAVEDLKETRPRPQSRQRLPEPEVAPRPELLPESLAPGEDAPEPKEFTDAVAAFRAGRPQEAAKLFGVLEARGDGWLLPPEARLNRARCLIAQNRREEARLILLAIGDSRFQAAVDRVLEGGSAPGKAP
jgi:tetratricopeptide (TPR) repeat protein